MAQRYRIYCGLTHGLYPSTLIRDEEFNAFLADEVVTRFPGFTVYNTLGYWKGQPEETRVIEVLTDDSLVAYSDVYVIANLYKELFSQEAGLVTEEAISGHLV
jgi:hypothetical protein